MLPKLCPPFGAEGGHRGEGEQHAAGVIHAVAQFNRGAVGITREVAQTADGSEQGGVASVIVLRSTLAVG